MNRLVEFLGDAEERGYADAGMKAAVNGTLVFQEIGDMDV
jgi:hypothetical protein